MSYVLFCPFCPEISESENEMKKHINRHVLEGGGNLGPMEVNWISTFLELQKRESRSSILRQAVIGCAVCQGLRKGIPANFVSSSRFKKKARSVDEHLRFHLRYYSFFCHLCIYQNGPNNQKKRVVIVGSGKAQHFRELLGQPLAKLFGRKANWRTVENHIKTHHLGKQRIRTCYKNETIPLNSLIGQKRISILERLISEEHNRHRLRYKLLSLAKRRLLRGDMLCPHKIEEIRRINLSPERSVFNMTPADEELLRDVLEIISTEEGNKLLEPTKKCRKTSCQIPLISPGTSLVRSGAPRYDFRSSTMSKKFSGIFGGEMFVQEYAETVTSLEASKVTQPSKSDKLHGPNVAHLVSVFNNLWETATHKLPINQKPIDKDLGCFEPFRADFLNDDVWSEWSGENLTIEDVQGVLNNLE